MLEDDSFIVDGLVFLLCIVTNPDGFYFSI